MFRFTFAAPAVLSLVLVTTGCQTIDMSQGYEDTTADMPRAERVPTAADLQRASQRTRVVLLEADAAAGPGKATKELAAAYGREVEAALAVMGVEIVDRSLAAKLEEEIKACEMHGRSKCGSALEPTVAQYAIKPVVTNATYSSAGVPEVRDVGGNGTAGQLIATYGAELVQRQHVDGEHDQFYVRPHVLHTAKLDTVVRVYEIPSLREVKGVTGSATRTRRTADRFGQVEAALMTDAVKAALPGTTDLASLANVFVPKAYVIGRRTGPKGNVYRISAGTAQGVIPDMDVTIATEKVVTDPITQRQSVDVIPVVRGSILKKYVEADHAWVEVDDAKKGQDIRLGDRVMFKHDDSLQKQLKEIFFKLAR